MTRVLWIGDAGQTTGFSRVTHAIGERLVTDYGHDVHVLAIGWSGRTPYTGPLKLWSGTGVSIKAAVGFDRMTELLEKLEPEVVITLEDLPLLVRRLFGNPDDKGQLFANGPWRRIAYLPVDGTGLPPNWRKALDVVTPVAMTKFGALQLGTEHVVRHAVDTETFHPVSHKNPIVIDGIELHSKSDVRKHFGIDPEAFIVGRVDTNSGRKDWGSTWRVIEQAWPDLPKPALGMFHTKLYAANNGMNLESLLRRGFATFSVTNRSDFTDDEVAAYVNCWDVAISTSRGEGFGLGSAEALACGVPVLGPRHSAFPEVVGPGGVLVEPATVWTSAYGHDQQIVDWRRMAVELVALSRDTKRRVSLGQAGLEHIRSNTSWEAATKQFDELIDARSEKLTDAVVGVESA